MARVPPERHATLAGGKGVLMLRQPKSVLLFCVLSAPGMAQSFTGLRIHGPSEVEELTETLYTIVAEFDNSLSFDVTLAAELWLDPGECATIGPFGNFETKLVDQDVAERLHARYSFGGVLRSAELDVVIRDVPIFPLVVERVKPGGRFYLTPAVPWPNDLFDAVRVYDRTGASRGTYLSSAVRRSVSTPAIDRDGSIILGQFNQNTIWILASGGQFEQFISGGGLNGPTGIALDPDGHIAAGSFFSDDVKFYTRTGLFLSSLSHQGTRQPLGLAYDRRGNLFVGSANNGFPRIAMFDAAHQFKRYLGEGTLAGDPLALVFNRAEDLWVATPAGLWKFARDGRLLDSVEQVGLAPGGLAIDENGNLYVTNTINFHVFVFDADGTLFDVLPVDVGPSPHPQRRLEGMVFELNPPPPDFNADGVVDLDDFSAMAVCLLGSGPERPSPFDDCDLFDLDGDNDLDLQDFVAFEQFSSHRALRAASIPGR